MNPPEPYYTPAEMGERTGLSPYVIRSYIAAGLIPPATIRGSRILYDQNHLRRLELICRLKEALLPLRDIQAALAELNNDQVTPFLESLGTEREAGEGREFPETPTLRNARARWLGRVRALRQMRSVAAEKGTVTHSDGTTWLRIALRPGMALWVRAPLAPADLRVVSHLLDVWKTHAHEERMDSE